MNDFDSRLGTALHDRVADVHPDLDHLVAASTRAGVRIRLRRRVGVSVAAAAGVAAVAAGAALVTGGTSGQPAGGGPAGFAAEPSATPTAAPTPSTPPTRRPAPESAPFAVTAPGWTCTEPADEKLDCSKGADAVHVVWRDAASHADYAAGTPDKSADWVSEVHHGVFVAIDGPGARQVGQSIRWARIR